MKGRLRQAPLPEMKFAFAGEKSLAQHLLRAYERATLGEVLLIRDEHVADQIRMIEQVDALVTDFEEHDVAVLFRGLDHEWKPAARELEHHVSGESRARPGWDPCIWMYGGHRE